MGGRIPDMKVLLAGGTKRPAGELKVGDKVDTLHQHSFKRQEAEVTYVRAVESPLLELTLSGKSFVCAEEDQFYVPRVKRWVHALDLVEGDKVSQLEGEAEYEGQKKLGKGQSVELTVEGPHTYVCDGVLMHNKGGSPPPPPTIIMPPPPPPPQIVQDVTPAETYRDASDYMKRMDDRYKEIERRRWDAGQTPAATDLARSQLELRLAENAAQLAPPDFGSQTSPGSGAATAAVINALAPKVSKGSQSRDVRIRPTDAGATGVSASATPEERLARAQKAYKLAEQRKKDEVLTQPEFQQPGWADRDWYPVIDKWAERSDKVEVGDTDPKIIKA